MHYVPSTEEPRLGSPAVAVETLDEKDMYEIRRVGIWICIVDLRYRLISAEVMSNEIVAERIRAENRSRRS